MVDIGTMSVEILKIFFIYFLITTYYSAYVALYNSVTVTMLTNEYIFPCM
mgnify:CR=1 FL=1